MRRLGRDVSEDRAETEVILATAQRTGYLALVNRRIEEEIQTLAAAKGDKRATEVLRSLVRSGPDSFDQ